ncbi:tumor necrosis factor receptor superfamily member 1A [Plectropomus leopardus]|uniref:tumor necrosis factor receptor superfamily member 1A n=1 Tax=Plectropomus leopardus TaxID=160734 RepID=UPI001C4CE0EC|nr:tumor necrosis factor receptor superfamily member 1A [Plectropomus leopardus]
MDFVLVFPLIVCLLSPGQSYAEVTDQERKCYRMCPPGYHKVGHCSDPVAVHKCKKCGDSEYTEKENTSKDCLRCKICEYQEVQIKPCTYNSNTVCDCQKGYYYEGSSLKDRYCQACNCKNCEEPDNDPDYIMKCQPCQRKECLEVPECKRKCAASHSRPHTSTAATMSASTSIITASTKTTASNNKTDPIKIRVTHNAKESPWLILVVFLVTVMVTFMVFCLLLLVFAKNPLRFSCLCWRTNKDLEPPAEDPPFSGQNCHQSSSPDTQTLHISEKTPMMTNSHSPAPPEHPAHIGPLPPDAEHKAARQDKQTEHWPAIVLYAIIKEVPLRRWKEFLRLLSVADQELERVELEASFCLGSMERQYQMLRLWSQHPSASLNDVFSALHYMDLSGCAQLLQESLEKLNWSPEVKQGVSGTAQDT